MAERQVSVCSKPSPLPALFMAMAPQNPIDQEGTYPLPEAQLDRFLLHVAVDYPDVQAERTILQLARAEAAEQAPATPVHVTEGTVMAARQQVLSTHMADSVEEYVVQLKIGRASCRERT